MRLGTALIFTLAMPAATSAAAPPGVGDLVRKTVKTMETRGTDVPGTPAAPAPTTPAAPSDPKAHRLQTRPAAPKAGAARAARLSSTSPATPGAVPSTPPPPPLRILSPRPGARITGDVVVSAAVGEGIQPQFLIFTVDGERMAALSTLPFQWRLPDETLSPGVHTLGVELYGGSHVPAARAHVRVRVMP